MQKKICLQQQQQTENQNNLVTHTKTRGRALASERVKEADREHEKGKYAMMKDDDCLK